MRRWDFDQSQQSKALETNKMLCMNVLIDVENLLTIEDTDETLNQHLTFDYSERNTPRSSLCVNGGVQLPLLAVNWRVQPYNESSAFSENIAVYAKTDFIRCPAAEYVTQKPGGNFNQTPPT